MNSWIFAASEHIQMVSLGFLALIFNIFIVLAIKKIFNRKGTNTNDSFNKASLEDLFKEYSITNREQEIIKLICEGKTNKEIGEILFISPVTVRDHNSNIFRKTNVTNRTQLAGLFQAYY
jgi:DNA-binding NarL/FixJ family response regulator